MSITTAKAEIRKRILSRRNSVSTEWRSMASADLARKALGAVSSGPSGPVAGYWPIRSEADPVPLMERLSDFGRPLALPIVRHPALLFRRWIPGVDLIESGFGTMGPDESADEVRPAILLVPLAAFDEDGNRLGWGQGHYDRAIEMLLGDGGPLLTVGIAFSFQQVEQLPVEAHDRKLDLIATEQGLLQPSRS